jgi:hypothetical protein
LGRADRRESEEHTAAVSPRSKETFMTVTHPSETARTLATRNHELLIGGEWVASASGMTFETRDPGTGELLATVAEGGARDIDRAVRAARTALEDGPWSRMTPSERGRIIHRIGDLIMEHADELAELDSLDNGKPKAVALAADVPLAADIFWYMSGWATKLKGGTVIPSVPYMPDTEFHAYTTREPVGVGEDDVRRLATELQGEPFQIAGGGLDDLAAGQVRAGEGDLVDVEMGRQRRAATGA